MNAEAYLRKQGWQGAGHSLDGEGRGIAKPLLIAHKQDQLGLGKKKAAHTTDDQWWMRAFDESLKSIGTGKDSTLNQIRTQGINRGGLYGFFVRGEGIAGTLSSSDDTPATSDSDAKSKSKRKRDGGADPVASKKSKKDKKDKKDKKKDKKAVSETDAVAKKLAKLSVDEKKSYEERAQAKGQSLEEYVRRRIQKKDEQRAAR